MKVRRFLPVFCLLLFPSLSHAQVEQLDVRVTDVVTGGWWETEDARGLYRLVVLQDGWEHLWSRHYLQWLEVPHQRGPYTVLASVALEDADSPWGISTPRLEFREGGPVFVLEQAHNSGNGAKRVVEIYPAQPGEYSAAVVLDTWVP